MSSKFVEFSMQDNRPFSVGDRPIVDALSNAGFNIGWDYMWLIRVHSEEELKRVLEIINSFEISKTKTINIIG